MRKKYNNPKLKFYIGDVRDYQSVLNVVRGVDFIYHAAALKQVPSCEFHPLEAVKTNVLGTENVLEAAITCRVKRVVVLSTDKAVYPINAMGISKAMMEKVAAAKSRSSNEHCDQRHPLRQRDVLTWFGDSAVHTANPRRSTHHHHRPGHDPLHDDAGRCCGLGVVCV
jgi:FlaA1/EpsC-like NDP-sugar epimerase